MASVRMPMRSSYLTCVSWWDSSLASCPRNRALCNVTWVAMSADSAILSRRNAVWTFDDTVLWRFNALVVQLCLNVPLAPSPSHLTAIKSCKPYTSLISGFVWRWACTRRRIWSEVNRGLSFKTDSCSSSMMLRPKAPERSGFRATTSLRLMPLHLARMMPSFS